MGQRAIEERTSIVIELERRSKGLAASISAALESLDAQAEGLDAARVADELGRPLGPATMFTGLAIQIFCPRAVVALTDGVPFSLFG